MSGGLPVQEFGVQGFPTIKLFVDGKVVEDYQVRAHRRRRAAADTQRALMQGHPTLARSSTRRNGADTLWQRPAAATPVVAVGALDRSNLPQFDSCLGAARHRQGGCGARRAGATPSPSWTTA
jgi:hypothetical protein